METANRPSVVTWFKVYCWLLMVYGLLVILMSIAFFVTKGGSELPAKYAKVYGGMFLLIGLPFLIAGLLGAFLRPKPSLWVYGIVFICLGMTTWFLPLCIPLLVFWLKKETKAYYGR